MSITDDEMEAFEIQAECRYLYKPQIFGSDHGKMWKRIWRNLYGFTANVYF